MWNSMDFHAATIIALERQADHVMGYVNKEVLFIALYVCIISSAFLCIYLPAMTLH